MKYILTLKLTFYILIINLFFNLYAFTQINSNNNLTKPFSQERQLLSVNLLPSHSAIFPPFVNSLMKNIDTFTGLAKINLNEIKLSGDISAKGILNAVNVKGSFWYIPDISYTFLFNRFVGIELGIGAQSVSYSLNIPKDTVSSLLEISGLLNGRDETVKSIAIGYIKELSFKTSLVYIPIHLGLKIMSGKTHKTINTFKIGLETVVYNTEVKNIFSGYTYTRSSYEATAYISYELGWQIDLFPNKNWRVKPYLDFSLFEIGYYIKSATGGIYEDIRDGILNLLNPNDLPFGIGKQFSGALDFIYTWNDIQNLEYGKYAKYATSLKIAIFPRFGFTIRF